MFKKILFAISLSLILTGCGNKMVQNSNLEKNNFSSNSNEKSKKQSNKKENSPYQDIYDLLDGKKLYFQGSSWFEAIYFYKDGYFDGAMKMGNGYEVDQSLYNGKFEITEKIDDHTYRLKKIRFAYDIKPGEVSKKNIDGTDFTFKNAKTHIFQGDSSTSYILYLPDKKTDDLNSDLLKNVKLSGKEAGSDKLGFIALRKDDNKADTLVEFTKK